MIKRNSQPNKMQTMYFAKDMRVISDKYRKGYDQAEWEEDNPDFEQIDEGVGVKVYRFKGV